MYFVSDLLCVMCYVIKTLGKKVLVTKNDRIMILGIDPKFGLSILTSNSKIFSNRINLLYFEIKFFFI